MFLPLHDRNPVIHIRFAYVNYTLIAFTILVFVFQSSLSQDGFDLLNIEFGMIPAVLSGKIDPPLAYLPQGITLFTYAFLHANWMHVLTNMLFLWIFGDNIEDALGHLRYFIFYLLCAAAAALTHMLMIGSDYGPLIGASGAVAGVMGAYAILYPHARVFVLARIIIPLPLPLPAFFMLGFWLATQLFYVLIGSDEPVAWWAHIGGICAGALLGAMMKRRSVPLFGGR